MLGGSGPVSGRDSEAIDWAQTVAEDISSDAVDVMSEMNSPNPS